MSLRSSPRLPRSRRFLFPILILATAGVMAIRASKRQAAQMADVQQFVTAMVQLPVAADRGPSDDLPPGLAGQLDLLREEIAVDPDRVSVRVRPGDVDEPGDRRATHTATIIIDPRPRLGLRLHRNRDSGHITVLGYWLPQPE
jgi:hypothetical protein